MLNIKRVTVTSAVIFQLLILVQLNTISSSTSVVEPHNKPSSSSSSSQPPSSSSSSSSSSSQTESKNIKPLNNDATNTEEESLKTKKRRSAEIIFGNTNHGNMDGLVKNDLNTVQKRDWSSFSTWGKRSVQELNGLQKKWKQMSVWGKRESPENLDKRWKQMSVWGKRESPAEIPEELEKKWKQMSVWGKRESPENLDKRWKQMSVSGKRESPAESPEELEKKWKQMSVWGKRESPEDLEKRWKQMSVWGKRESPENLDKRWKQMSVWGKRESPENLDKRWKQMSVWGKRSIDDLSAIDKKWKQMSVWGKRDSDPEMDKKWKQMSVWGKRDADDLSSLEKRWKQMSVWGKRDPTDIDTKLASLSSSALKDLQKPSRDSDMVAVPVLGMSHFGLGHGESLDHTSINGGDKVSVEKRWRRRKNWRPKSGKRPSWSQTGFSSWGKKRSANDLDTRSLLNRLVRMQPAVVDSDMVAVPVLGMSHFGLGHGESLDHTSINGGDKVSVEKRWRRIKNSRPKSGKRPSWTHTGFTSWGKKRSANDLDSRSLLNRLVRMQPAVVDSLMTRERE